MKRAAAETIGAGANAQGERRAAIHTTRMPIQMTSKAQLRLIVSDNFVSHMRHETVLLRKAGAIVGWLLVQVADAGFSVSGDPKATNP